MIFSSQTKTNKHQNKFLSVKRNPSKQKLIKQGIIPNKIIMQIIDFGQKKDA